jgi:carbamoyltransferase
MGGCALNCVANSIAKKYYKDVWIMPNPGDAGSSLGSILAVKQRHIHFNSPYLGYNIAGKYPVNSALKELKTNRLVGVANGRAEFGPRALGNRSLFADPRGKDVKDLVNTVKRRQEFRPFAPVILEEHAHNYFDGPTGPYMQFTSVCKDPEQFPAIAHLDNTSRVQTVNQFQHPMLHELLTRWYADTGCPMILNTSLNIKGEPMVDTEVDAKRWQDTYNVRVLTQDE